MAARGAWILGLVALAACGDADGVHVARVTPPYGPVIGGTLVTIEGSGFSTAPGAPNRVQIGGREAPLVATIDDGTLEVVIPPGDRPGDAEVVVISADRVGRATGVFRYSTPPTITAVEPADVLFTASTARITVTGTGFAAEDAGDVTVALDGVPQIGVNVVSDSTLTFIATSARPLDEPDLEVADRRGHTLRRRAFRFVPSTRPGLLLFPRIGAFAVFVDPVERTSMTIPWVAGASVAFGAVVLDERGEYWALDLARRWGHVDMKTQRIEAPFPVQACLSAAVRVGPAHFALDFCAVRFGRFDPGSGSFGSIGDVPLPCCDSYGLATDGGAFYFTARGPAGPEINTVDPETGAFGTPVPLTGAPAGFAVEEMRFFEGTLYATSRNNGLATINPLTGEVTVLSTMPSGWFPAMELFVPVTGPR